MIDPTQKSIRLACFVTSHGFGHATRVAALIQELSKFFSHIDLKIFGGSPSWFWALNLPRHCSYKVLDEITDIGLIQVNPFEHDLSQTISKIEKFLEFSDGQLNPLVNLLNSYQPHFILCDISPLGVELGYRLNIPTYLIENFTWDWIYKAYVDEDSRFVKIIKKLDEIYSTASMRIQSKPLCHKLADTPKVNPIFRQPSLNRDEVFSRLDISLDEKYILVTTGGISMDYHLTNDQDSFLLVLPGNYQKICKKNNLIFLPMNSFIPFIDLVRWSSGVVGKAGYGTVSECWAMEVPFLGVFRDSFRESEILRNFCRYNLQFKEISKQTFINGSWMKLLPKLFESRTVSEERENGAIKAVQLILGALYS